MWGDFKGYIYTDRPLRSSASVLTSPSGRRDEVRPLVKYVVKSRGINCWSVKGACKLGEFSCDLFPTDRAVLGTADLVGELQVAGRAVGNTILGAPTEMHGLGEIKSADKWKLALFAERRNPIVSEGDVLVLDSEYGAIVKIQRRDSTWREELQSWFGLGLCRRGVFLDNAVKALDSSDKQVALLFLLAAYFKLLELRFNTDWSAG